TVEASGGSGSIVWTVPEADYDATWEDGDQVEFQGTNYTVSVPDGEDPQTVELTEFRPVPDDVETTEINGTEYAVVEGEDGDRELVPLEEFLTETYGPAETRTL
ncbi:MAG: hypothetical protein GWN07_01105, partial [Actinobacteria bacterium]|nr:hypothetical protein [Actinomycetota bacterium]NIU64126.1 hypothetical protein [Actinomycetota bacterium]NIW25927.1 hypothetical protein [Actinomycetota bacterium]NIX18516.1 hypothetical protein [Actinomycetota bacterium]